MYPDLFYMGNFIFKTHYLLIIMGIIAGFIMLLYTTKGLGHTQRARIIVFAAIIFIPFMLGGRAGSDAERIISGKPPCTSYFYVIGSVSLWWGLLCAVITAFPLSKLLKVNIWDTADHFAVSISLGAVFVRAGCFMRGCCHGTEAEGTIFAGYSFAPNSPAYYVYGDTPVIPTQLYEAMSWLAIFLILFLRFHRKSFNGEIIVIMFALYSFLRFLLEFLRYHASQVSSIVGKTVPLIVLTLSIIAYIIIKNFLVKKYPGIFRP